MPGAIAVREGIPSFTELSARTGVSLPTISRVFHGPGEEGGVLRDRWPGRETTQKLAKACGMSPGEFVDFLYAWWADHGRAPSSEETAN